MAQVDRCLFEVYNNIVIHQCHVVQRNRIVLSLGVVDIYCCLFFLLSHADHPLRFLKRLHNLHLKNFSIPFYFSRMFILFFFFFNRLSLLNMISLLLELDRLEWF
jgi:hypothetical protein